MLRKRSIRLTAPASSKSKARRIPDEEVIEAVTPSQRTKNPSVEASITSSSTQSASSSAVKFHALRLLPGQEIKSSLQEYCKKNKITAAAIVTCVGSVTEAELRLAHDPHNTANPIKKISQHHEIISLVGTISMHGEHLHMSLSDAKGQCVGGHLMGGAKVYTTAEIVLAEWADTSFEREHCPLSGWPELAIKQQK